MHARSRQIWQMQMAFGAGVEKRVQLKEMEENKDQWNMRNENNV